MTMIRIKPGRFIMGSPEAEVGHASQNGRFSDETQGPQRLTQPFYLAKTEITQLQWQAVMGSNPSPIKAANLPVDHVSWRDAQAFIARLNAKHLAPKGWQFALPSEIQWEYACRAGARGPYGGHSLEDIGWYRDNSGGRTHEVALKAPNRWGLHDMHGNVSEWCLDQYSSKTSASAAAAHAHRVFRGGFWDLDAAGCRAAYRNGAHPDCRDDELGLRPALVGAP